MLAQKLIFRQQCYLVRVIAYYLPPWGFKLLEMTIYISVCASRQEKIALHRFKALFWLSEA